MQKFGISTGGPCHMRTSDPTIGHIRTFMVLRRSSCPVTEVAGVRHSFFLATETLVVEPLAEAPARASPRLLPLDGHTVEYYQGTWQGYSQGNIATTIMMLSGRQHPIACVYAVGVGVSHLRSVDFSCISSDLPSKARINRPDRFHEAVSGMY